MQQADFVIIGSGSAGSALAYRLSEDGRNSVLVIEAGGSDFGPFIQMPAALAWPMSMKRYNWGYLSEPEPNLNNRRITAPRGKVIGGSSSINGMVYVRGHAEDFNRWEELGASGWAYADVLPYFKRMEHSHGGEEGWRGTDGPLHVQRGGFTNPLFGAFIEAGKQAGFETTEDYNGSKQEGFGLMEQTIFAGRRWSAANAYLKPALKRDNVGIVYGLARRIVIEDGRATGVEIECKGKVEVIKATREVIVSASAFNSPKLLMLSGIGPGAHLQEMGIEVKADRPGVGANLQDHMEFYFQQVSTKPVSLYSWLPWFWQGVAGAQWLLSRGGLGASNQFEACAFLRSAPGLKQPDIQYHFLPVAISYDGKAAAKSHGFQVHVGYNLSKSRGSVTLRSPDPKADPVLRFNYMSHPEDWEKFRHCVRLTREIFGQKAFDTYRGPEIQPGEGVQSNDEIDAFLREHLESAYHPCGTCKMGAKDDPMAVVDPQTRVIGVDGLRVADSSIFPHVTYGNLNGPSIMTGEKAADHILGKQPLARSNQEPWVNPRAAISDR
ncbi:choline dehydrogenase [Rhizobium bangladeshense]|uniref:Oxygen-dependent choline dehydrogenase n=1 Tax=Rhizobium bangladeshense TaxID=1138189 RepID=A0ABS7LMC2_9HYPH|nr:choline dehydrogenase [Rhizobium bangladeshense]MBX4869356.1 choline dehydrogenase [Rhizobium bangladeshense]MBX4874750.1 choline dehydrogenase [Rhizobium bangladeshense]MBX4885209.1 choline dehydrogenase [Rhizobium bangladeshense]MBX4892024.1 choline dehydrogenase [Rhizobium bangladeshense]MBX4902516.1 choline dehydrogenase [Rhizobium bangladeshense]